MRIFLTIIALTILSPIAHAETIAVGENGRVTLTGEIVSIFQEEMTVRHENGTTDVSFEEMDEDVAEQLDNANIIQPGNIVTVEGWLTEGSFATSVIEAENIYITPTP